MSHQTSVDQVLECAVDNKWLIVNGDRISRGTVYPEWSLERDTSAPSEDDEVTHRFVGRDYFFTRDEEGSDGRDHFLRVCRTEFEQRAVREIDHRWNAS